MDDKYGEYFINRTIDDIMTEYGEEREEYETLFERKDGHVVRFKHNNGRTFFCVQYDSDYIGTVLLDQEKNKNRTIEKQMERFFISTSSELYINVCKKQYDNNALVTDAIKLCDYDGIEKLVLKEDVLIGVMIKGSDKILFPETPVTINQLDKDYRNNEEVFLIYIYE